MSDNSVQEDNEKHSMTPVTPNPLGLDELRIKVAEKLFATMEDKT